MCGVITKVCLILCSFVDFATLDGATSAVNLTDVYLHGKKLIIRLAESTTNSGNSEWNVCV